MAISIADLIKMLIGAPLKVDLDLGLVLSGIQIGSIRVTGTVGLVPAAAKA